MKFNVFQIAKILKLDRDSIKTMAYHFRDYLEPEANPQKGIPRLFTLQDIPVLAYVSNYWEDAPDYDSIQQGLNANEHREHPYTDFITMLTPVFREVPEDIEEKGSAAALIMGMSMYDRYFLACYYKHAGDMLVEAAIKNDNAYELVYPILFNYRHATGLYLKASIKNARFDHDLFAPLQELKLILQQEFGVLIPQWFENIILDFKRYDPKGTTFRYESSFEIDETYIDLLHLETLMTWLCDSFKKMRLKQGLPC
jgi:hypothetical protein